MFLRSYFRLHDTLPNLCSRGTGGLSATVLELMTYARESCTGDTDWWSLQIIGSLRYMRTGCFCRIWEP